MRQLSPLLIACALAMAPPGVAGADPAETTRQAALLLLDAIEGLAEAREAEDRTVALAATIRAHEDALAAVRDGLREAALRETAIAQAFQARSGTVSELLAAMLMVDRVQGPALQAHPAGPLGTARAGMMIGDLVPALQAEADRIGAELAEVQTLRALRVGAQDRLTEGLASLQSARAELVGAIAERRELPPPIGQDEAMLLALLEAAETLQVLSAGLGGLLGAETRPAPGFEAARGTLPLPARARLLTAAGAPGPDGTVRPGLMLGTEPGALVTLPWASVVRYQGALSDYANVILLEPGAGYLLLVAGLGTVYAERGETLPAGAPLGTMPGGTYETDRTAGQAGAAAEARSARLYLELRHQGQPIDPGDWFDLTGASP